MSVINIYVQKIQKIQKILIKVKRNPKYQQFFVCCQTSSLYNIYNTTSIQAKTSDGFQIQFDSHEEPDARAITGMANFFDYGAMLGGVVAGFLSDQTRGRISVVNISGRHLSV